MFLINILDIFKNLILFRYLILAFCLLGLFLMCFLFCILTIVIYCYILNITVEEI